MTKTSSNMVQASRLVLTDYLLWGEADFSFEPGLTLIQGDNGSGKTLLWRAFQHGVNFGSAKRGTSAAKMPARSSVVFEFTKADHDYVVKSGASSMRIERDEEDMGLRGLTAPREELGRLLNIPQSLYDASVHLTGPGVHPLSTGTPGTRLQWLGDVLDINKAYDALLRKVEKKLAPLKDSTELLAVTQAQLKAIHIPDIEITSASVKADIDEARDAMTLMVKEFETRRRIADVRAQITLNLPERDLQALLEKTKRHLKHYRKAAEAQTRYEDAHNRYEGNRAKAKSLTAEMATLAATPGFDQKSKKLKDADRELTGRYERIAGDHATWTDEGVLRDRLAKLKKPKLGRKLLQQQRDKLSAEIAVLADEIEVLQEALSALSDHKHAAQCPTCGSKIDPKRMLALHDKAVAARKGKRSEVEVLDRDLAYYSLAEQITISSEPEDPVPLAKKIKAIRRALKVQAEHEQLHARLQELGEVDATLPPQPEPLVDDTGSKIKNLGKYLEQLEEQVEAITDDLSILRVLKDSPDTDPRFAKLADKDLKQRLKALAKAVDAHETIYAETLQREGVAKEAKAERKRLKKQVKSLSGESALARQYGLLKEYFGPRGGRIGKIREAAGEFVRELNRQAHLMWNTPFRFDVEVDADGLNMFCERNGLRADITSLSASEDKAWRCLCAMVLMKMLPAHYRTDFILLDEMEANLSSASRYKFAREFVPELMTVVPKVIMITPLNREELLLVPDRVYQVVKERGRSRLERIDDVSREAA